MTKTKICITCNKRKSVLAFSVDRARKGGRNCYCLKCARIRNNVYYSKPESKEVRKNTTLNRRYGIGISQRTELLQKQEGKCALCGREEKTYGRSLHVDHIHGMTGPKSIRGLLCDFCNGYFLPWTEKHARLMSPFVLAYVSSRPLLRNI